MPPHDRNLCESCLHKEYEDFAHECIHESMEKNDSWLEQYRINNWPRWDYSLEDCTLTFSEAGKAKVICSVRAVGSVQGGSWEWSWGNKNLPDACKNRMEEVRALGEEKGWRNLRDLFLDNKEYLGWEFASITSHVLDGIAVYRCPDSETPGYFMYLVILSSEFVN